MGGKFTYVNFSNIIQLMCKGELVSKKRLERFVQLKAYGVHSIYSIQNNLRIFTHNGEIIKYPVVYGLNRKSQYTIQYNRYDSDNEVF